MHLVKALLLRMQLKDRMGQEAKRRARGWGVLEGRGCATEAAAAQVQSLVKPHVPKQHTGQATLPAQHVVPLQPLRWSFTRELQWTWAEESSQWDLIKVQKLRGSRSFGKATCLTRCGAAHSMPHQAWTGTCLSRRDRGPEEDGLSLTRTASPATASPPEPCCAGHRRSPWRAPRTAITAATSASATRPAIGCCSCPSSRGGGPRSPPPERFVIAERRVACRWRLRPGLVSWRRRLACRRSVSVLRRPEPGWRPRRWRVAPCAPWLCWRGRWVRGGRRGGPEPAQPWARSYRARPFGPASLLFPLRGTLRGWLKV